MRMNLGAFNLRLPFSTAAGKGIFSTFSRSTRAVPAPRTTSPIAAMIQARITQQPSAGIVPRFAPVVAPVPAPTRQQVAAPVQMLPPIETGGTRPPAYTFEPGTAPTPQQVAQDAFTPPGVVAPSAPSTTNVPAPVFSPPPEPETTPEVPAVSPVPEVTLPATPAPGRAFSVGGALGAGVAGFFIAGPIGAAVGLVAGGKLLGKKA